MPLFQGLLQLTHSLYIYFMAENNTDSGICGNGFPDLKKAIKSVLIRLLPSGVFYLESIRWLK